MTKHFRDDSGRRWKAWLATAEIPPDKASYGTFDELQDEAEADVHAIIEEIAASDHPRGTEEQQIGDFYRAYT